MSHVWILTWNLWMSLVYLNTIYSFEPIWWGYCRFNRLNFGQTLSRGISSDTLAGVVLDLDVIVVKIFFVLILGALKCGYMRLVNRLVVVPVRFDVIILLFFVKRTILCVRINAIRLILKSCRTTSSCKIESSSSKGLVFDHANFAVSISFLDHPYILCMWMLVMISLLSTGQGDVSHVTIGSSRQSWLQSWLMLKMVEILILVNGCFVHMIILRKISFFILVIRY